MSLKKKLTVLTFEELCRLNTAPVLRTDSNWVKEDGPAKATGNVLKALTHAGAPFGSFADRADSDADGNVLKVTTTGTFFGKFGILTLNANGTYSYKLYTTAQKPAAAKAVQGLSEGETLRESFTYKATDGFVTKGSVLKITIFGTDDPVKITDLTPAALGGDAVVDEDGLPGAVLDAARPGETDSTESATATGNFKISAPDGIDDLLVGGTAVITNGVFTAKTITTPLGNELKIIAFNAATGVVTYTYKLLAAETHPGAGEDSIFEQFVVKLTDVDGSSATASLDIRIVDDQPTIEVCEHQNDDVIARVIVDECVPPNPLVVDETDLATDVTGDFSGLFISDFGADGPGSIDYTLATSAGPSGLIDTLSGDAVVVAKEGNDIVGRIGPNPTDIVFVISIDPNTGVVELDQQRAVVHAPNLSPNDFVGLPFDLIKVVATITDNDGDKASATFDAGNFFGFIDDAPAIDASNSPLPKLVTDDSDIPDIATADFSSAFISAFGNDGPKDADDNDIEDADALVYELVIGNVASGVQDVLTGENVLLSLNGSVVEGRTAISNLLAFTISVDTSGLVQLTQDRALVHPTNPDPNEPVFLDPGVIGLKATITDGDLDQASATIDVTSAFCFNDDGPAAVAGSSSGEVDEDKLLPNGIEGGPGDIDGGAGTTTTVATGSVTSLFDPGNDLPPSYIIKSDPASIATLEALLLKSGLVDLTYAVAGDTLTASAGATEVFTFKLDAATGGWTFTLKAPLDHPVAGTEDDLLIDFGGLIRIVDADGDWADATGSVVVTVDDDTPTLALTQPGTGIAALDETSAGSTAPAINLGAVVPGDDPDVGGTGAIASAVNIGGIVNPVIAFGADGPAAVGPVQYGLLVGPAPSGLSVTDGSPITLVAVSPTVVAGIVSGGPFNGTAAFAIEINAITGAITVEQYLSLDHPLNPDPNDLLQLANDSLLASVAITDRDGDPASANISIAGNIRFFDDGPSLTATVDPKAKAALDETATTSTPAALVVTDIGDDAHVAGSGAIATAIGLGPVVSTTILFGADGPAAGGGTVFALNVLSANSGLFTTDGSAITLVEEGNLVVGRVASGADSGKAAFAISIDATGVLTVEQYLSLDHPDTTNPDDTVFLATGTLGVDVTVTDGDGDSLTQSADISAQVCFDDDGPSLTVLANGQVTAALDETTTTSTPATLGVTNIGDDTDVGGIGAISTTTTSGPLVTATALFGSDGPAASSPTVYALNVTNATSGLFTTDGSAIALSEEGGLIVGRVASGTLAGQAAFAISIDATTGIVKVEQYLSLEHPINPNPDDTVFLAPGTVEVTVTVTDGDGDSLTAGADVSGQFSFDDDGPTAYSVVNPNQTDDEGKLPLYPSNEGEATTLGTDADVAGSPSTASGGPGTLFAAGADGLQSISITGPAVQAIYKLASGAPAQEGVTYASTTDLAGNVTLTATGAVSGNPAFTLTINADGSYFFTQSAALVHPLFDPSNEDDLPLAFDFTVTDKDGDPATGSLTVTVDDDTPVGGATVANVDEVATLTNLMLIVDVSGSMGGASGIGGLTRLQAAQQAMIDLINAYDANGDVVVRIVTFSTGAAEVGSQWMSTSQAITAIGALVAGGITNYDAGLAAAQTAFPDAGAIAGGQNVSYFLSDGVPNPASAGIDGAEETVWEGFLTTNDIVSFALGMGGDVNAAALNPVAYDGVTPAEANATIVDDFADLSNVLVNTATPILVSGTVPGSFGADGGLFSLTGTGAPSGFTYEVSGNTLLVKDATTLATVLTLTMDPVTGAYTLKQNGPIDHPGAGADVLPFVFTVALTDGDFDGATSTITVNIKDGVPTASNVVAGTLDDDSRTAGLPGGTGDFEPTLSTLSGSLGTAYGSDGPGSISFAALHGTSQLINGITVSFSWNAGTSTLTANDGEENVFEVIVNQATGGYTVNLLASLDHHTNALADNVETDATFNLAYVITDGDTDTANGTLSFTIDDDTPISLTPDAEVLTNVANASSNSSLPLPRLDSDGNIDNNVGADQLGSIAFANIANGQQATGVIGGLTVNLTSGTKLIKLYLADHDANAATPLQLQGWTDFGTGTAAQIFTVTLLPDGSLGTADDRYSVTLLKPIDNGSGVVFSDLTGTGAAGNPTFKIIGTPSSSLELLVTPGDITNSADEAGSTVNSNSFSLGLGGGQSIAPADPVLRIDYGAFSLFDDPVEVDVVLDNFNVDSHTNVNGARFQMINFVPGSAAGMDILLTVYDADGDNTLAGDAGDPKDTINLVRVYDADGTTVLAERTLAEGDGAEGGYTFDFLADGSVSIANLQENDFVAVSTATGFNRLEIDNIDPQGDRFKLTGLAVETTLTGSPIDLTYDLALTDGDGDKITIVGAIDVTLNPVAII